MTHFLSHSTRCETAQQPPSFRPHFADHSGFWLLTSCWWRESDPGLTAGSIATEPRLMTHISLSEPPRSGSIPALPHHFRAEVNPLLPPFGSVEEKVSMMFNTVVNDDDKFMWGSKVLKQDVWEGNKSQRITVEIFSDYFWIVFFQYGLDFHFEKT